MSSQSCSKESESNYGGGGLRSFALGGGTRSGRRGSARKSALFTAVSIIKSTDVKLRSQGISQSSSNQTMYPSPTYGSASAAEELWSSSFNWVGVMGDSAQKRE